MSNIDSLTRRLYSKYFNLTLFKYFSRNFKYSLPVADGQKQYDDMGREATNPNDAVGNWQDVCEPIVPTTDKGINQLIEGLTEINNATLSKYAYFWLSHLDVPAKTQVNVDDKYFRVETTANYEHTFGLHLYFLRGRDDMNELSTPDSAQSVTTSSSAVSSDGDNPFEQ